MSVGSLGYVGFEVTDPEAWTPFMTDVLGAAETKPSEGEQRYRVDVRAWRIATAQGPRDDIAYAGFEVANAAALAEASKRLAHLGFEVAAGSEAFAATRGVSGLAICQDPFGLQIELFWGALERHEAPFASPRGVGGFVTGDEGLGHIVLSAPDMEHARTFYRDGLGFHLADIIRLEVGAGRSIEMEFFYCNQRHHTVALVPAPLPKRLHHLMLQVGSLDDVGFALDRAEAAGVPLALTLGRHTNDHMVSFYLRTPAGFEVEYGWGARSVDPGSWRVVRHNRTSSWGHKRPPEHRT